jgi:S1-C subfamily serine protease
MNILRLICCCFMSMSCHLSLLAADLTNEECASRLQQATVTVRIRLQSQVVANKEKVNAANALQNTLPNEDEATEESQVTVCSGVAVSEKLVITSAFAAADSQIKLTFPTGREQAAILRVIDDFSGLALLEVPETKLLPLPFAEKPVAAGTRVMTASAWGAEHALVSQGTVGGVGRTIKGAVYPPLLQCDVHITPTLSGSGLVNPAGELVGILVAADVTDQQTGWAYAVPVSHVQRLLRAQKENPRENTVVILKRLRPIVGVRLDNVDQKIQVIRVDAGSPADKAGILIGDRILSADGNQVRSVYEAVRPTLYKQPGDVMTFTIERNNEQKQIEFVLEGGMELPGASQQAMGQLIQPKLDIGMKRSINSRTMQRGTQAEITINESYRSYSNAANNNNNESKEANAQNITSNEKQAVEQLLKLLENQQQQLSEQQEVRRHQEALIQTLQEELQKLKKESK